MLRNMLKKFGRPTCLLSKVISDTVQTAAGLAKDLRLLISAGSNIRSNYTLPGCSTLTFHISTNIASLDMGLCMGHDRASI